MPITFDEYMENSHENNKESISNSFYYSEGNVSVLKPIILSSSCFEE